MTAIFKREFKSYFANPLGYIFLAAFYFFLGMFFYMIFSYGSPDISAVIMGMSSIVVFSLPVLTMRLMSEDRRQKVDQVLLTAPVSLISIVIGKFLAALAVFAIGFAPTVVFQIIVMSYVSVNIFSYLYTLIGMLLLGACLIAIGMFISSLTESTVVSAILTLVINIILLFMPNFASMVQITWIATVIEKLSFISAFDNFGANIFSISDIVYFLSIIAVFLFLCVRSLEKKRWS